MQNGHPAFVAFMLNMGCDILAQNEDGEDALALATKVYIYYIYNTLI